MEKKAAKWIDQADYDIDTAEFMFNGGRRLVRYKERIYKRGCKGNTKQK